MEISLSLTLGSEIYENIVGKVEMLVHNTSDHLFIFFFYSGLWLVRSAKDWDFLYGLNVVRTKNVTVFGYFRCCMPISKIGST